MDVSNDNSDTRPRRTNSLAFATTDCHRCAAQGKVCDRLRPQCSICLRQGQKCPGFVIPLSWDPRRLVVAQPPPEGGFGDDNEMQERPLDEAHSGTQYGGTKKFRFVEKPFNKRRKISTRPEAGTTGNIDQVAGRGNAATSAADQDNHGSSRFVAPDLPTGNARTITEDRDCSNAGPIHWGQGPAESDMDAQVIDDILPDPTLRLSNSRSTHDSTSFIGHTPLDDSNFDSSSFPSLPGLLGATPAVDAETMDARNPVFIDVSNGTFEHDFMTSLPSTTGIETLSNTALPELWTSSFPPAPLPNPSMLGTGSQSQYVKIARSLNLSDEVLLNMYDSELCILPVTSDTKHNPFRCRRDTSRGSTLLRHAISALVYQHLSHKNNICATEADEHRYRASEELNLALSSPRASHAESSLHLLDSLLIMFTLECTLSASGPWTQHLKRAASVLDAAGGASSLSHSRLRSQVAMLVWWDSTLALISRKGQILKPAYFHHVAKHENQDGWTFYDLSGCPSPLMSILVSLSQLATQQEVARSMEWLTFDMTPALAIYRKLQELKAEDLYPPNHRAFSSAPGSTDSSTSNPQLKVHDLSEDSDAEEEQVNLQSDAYHCVEAWRHALLTYTIRVFLLDQPSQGSADTTRRPESEAPSQTTSANTARRLWARSTHDRLSSPPAAPSKHQRDLRRQLHRAVRTSLNHVRCVRRSSQTQKQLLLPIFLAGSETTDEELRGVVRGYCEWWANKSRYQMFSTVPDLLTDIWAAIDKARDDTLDGASDETPWWGNVIDEKLEMTAIGNKTTAHYLFG